MSTEKLTNQATLKESNYKQRNPNVIQGKKDPNVYTLLLIWELISYLHNTQPNGRPHASILHPISSITHKAASETKVNIRFKSNSENIIEYNNKQNYLYLQDNVCRNTTKK